MKDKLPSLCAVLLCFSLKEIGEGNISFSHFNAIFNYLLPLLVLFAHIC